MTSKSHASRLTNLVADIKEMEGIRDRLVVERDGLRKDVAGWRKEVDRLRGILSNAHLIACDQIRAYSIDKSRECSCEHRMTIALSPPMDKVTVACMSYQCDPVTKQWTRTDTGTVLRDPPATVKGEVRE